MITCYIRYTIDPYKLKEFEHYGNTWITQAPLCSPPPSPHVHWG